MFVHRVQAGARLHHRARQRPFRSLRTRFVQKFVWYSQYRPLQDEHFAPRVLTADRLPPDRIHRATARFRLIVLANADLRLPALAAAVLSTLAHLRPFQLQVRPYGRSRIRTTRPARLTISSAQLTISSFTRYTVLHTRAIHTRTSVRCLAARRSHTFLPCQPLSRVPPGADRTYERLASTSKSIRWHRCNLVRGEGTLWPISHCENTRILPTDSRMCVFYSYVYLIEYRRRSVATPLISSTRSTG